MGRKLDGVLLWATVLLAMVAAYVVGHDRGYDTGANNTVRTIAACTLEMARAERCWIPCEEFDDCMAKNGQGDH